MNTSYSIYTIGGMLLALIQPLVANATQVMEPLPVWAQMGVCGMLGGLHFWTLHKTIPRVADSHRSAMEQLAGQIDGLRKDLTEIMQAELKRRG